LDQQNQQILEHQEDMEQFLAVVGQVNRDLVEILEDKL
jgi:hypothetical protein